MYIFFIFMYNTFVNILEVNTMNNEYLKLLKDKKFLKSKHFKKLKKDINEYIKKDYLKV